MASSASSMLRARPAFDTSCSYRFPTLPWRFRCKTPSGPSNERSSRAAWATPSFNFMEVWLNPAVGFDAANAKAQIFGNGKAPISWISFEDVAEFAVASLRAPAARNAVIKLGGPDALTPLQVVETFEKVSGRRFSIDFVPEDALRAKWSGASDPIEKSFAGLMLYYTMGEAIDMTSPLRWCPINLAPVRQLAAQA